MRASGWGMARLWGRQPWHQKMKRAWLVMALSGHAPLKLSVVFIRASQPLDGHARCEVRYFQALRTGSGRTNGTVEDGRASRQMLTVVVTGQRRQGWPLGRQAASRCCWAE